MKKLISTLAVLALALSLAACGGGGGSSEDSTSMRVPQQGESCQANTDSDGSCPSDAIVWTARSMMPSGTH